MKKTKIIIALFAVFIVGYLYFFSAIGEQKMREIFNNYIQENIKDYQDFEEISFDITEGTTTPGERGYAGVGQYYEAEYAHKDHEWLRFYISTNGYELESNYEEVLKTLEYIDVATKLFHEKIDENKLILTSVYCRPKKIETEKYNKFLETPATKDLLFDYFEVVEPKITLNGTDFSYKELVDLDNKISQIFPDGSYYEIKFKDHQISCYSDKLQKYDKYEDLK